MKNKSNNRSNHNSRHSEDKEDNNTIQVIYFNYKTYMNEVYKVKETSSGADRIIPRDDQYNPPEDKEGGYGRRYDSWYG